MYTYRNRFATPYDQHAQRRGEPFKVLRVIDTADATHDAEVLPMFRIRFADGVEIEAWPEEVVAPLSAQEVALLEMERGN